MDLNVPKPPTTAPQTNSKSASALPKVIGVIVIIVIIIGIAAFTQIHSFKTGSLSMINNSSSGNTIIQTFTGSISVPKGGIQSCDGCASATFIAGQSSVTFNVPYPGYIIEKTTSNLNGVTSGLQGLSYPIGLKPEVVIPVLAGTINDTFSNYNDSQAQVQLNFEYVGYTNSAFYGNYTTNSIYIPYTNATNVSSIEIPYTGYVIFNMSGYDIKLVNYNTTDCVSNSTPLTYEGGSGPGSAYSQFNWYGQYFNSSDARCFVSIPNYIGQGTSFLIFPPYGKITNPPNGMVILPVVTGRLDFSIEQRSSGKQITVEYFRYTT